ncbi:MULTISPECIES: aldehyde dehydrogenase family protein [Halococcus]|uniref:Aldehyde dehydrogenase n=1 Tax=Halococcus salifodinae DSM 8989 TaxID=1227456 RepID=M0NCI8_9EURY|nr:MULTISPECIES: aldehyde dehydrogenase family protein [Halococcus]EMA55536.1 aldehyde dehydrogenase [Halococcus salifodinae DSM 8989]
MADTYENYVDGEWRASETGETFAVENPANTDETVAECQDSSSADARGAIEAAAAARDAWAETPGPARGKLLRETAKRMDDRREELTETLAREEGKALGEAGGEVGRAINIFYYYAEKAMDYAGEASNPSATGQNLYTVREPMGVAGLIVPWNYPIAIPSWKMAPALATGNTVVCKLSQDAPTVFLKVTECLAEAADAVDAPDGVVNVLTGGGEEVGQPIVEHDEVDAVSFTGSRSVGDMIYEQATDAHKRVQTELGSKNPTVVTESADVEEAAQIVGGGAFGVTGQACTATERVIVHESVHDEFVDALVDYAKSIEIGAALDGADMGPQANEGEIEGTLDDVETAKDEGATVEYGGGQPDGDEYENGYFVEPTILTGLDSDATVMQEEVFGPFVGIMTVSDFEEAIDLANDVEFGLAAGIVTDDHTQANRFVDEVDFGVVKVNEATTGLELHVPFGGMNASSSETYREQGEEGMDYFTIIKTVYDNY